MPFAGNQGVPIYYEVEGKGPPIAMMLGSGASLETWRETGVVEDLSSAYRLILIEPRGNGKSAKPHNPATYTAEVMVGDLLAVLDNLGIARTNYWGYSLGAGVGFHALRLAPHRFRSAILGGYSPYPAGTAMEWQGIDTLAYSIAMSIKSGTDLFAAYSESIDLGLEAISDFLERNFGPMAPAERVRFMANDSEAILAALEAAANWPAADGSLPSLSVPCFIYVAESDPMLHSARKAAASVPHGRFFVVPGAHAFNIQKDQVMSVVQRFLAEVNVDEPSRPHRRQLRGHEQAWWRPVPGEYQKS